MKPVGVALLLFVALVLAPNVLAANNSFEEFEDDTPGNAPASTAYTFSGATSTVGATTGREGSQGVQLGGATGGERDNFGFTNGFDLCDTGNVAQIDVYTSGNLAGGAVGVFETTVGTANTPHAAGRGVYLQFDFQATWRLFSSDGANTISPTTTTGFPSNEWMRIQFSAPDCAGGNVCYESYRYATASVYASGCANASGTQNFAGLDTLWVGDHQLDDSEPFAQYNFDNLCVGSESFCEDDPFIINAAPPAGLRGEVTDAVASPETFTVSWLLSPDDTDPATGAFTYRLYYDDGGETLAATVPPGNAVNGVLATTINAAITGSVDWYVTADDGVAVSDASCIITLDADTQGDTDSCGTAIPGEEQAGSDLTGDDGALFGGDKQGLADALQVSVTSLDFLMGIMLTLLILAGGFFAYGAIGAAGGGMVGLVLSYAFDLFPFWSIYVLGFFLAAGAILYVKTRSGGA